TGFKDLQAALELTCRRSRVTRDNENLGNACFPAEPCEKFVQYFKALDAARNNVRDRLHAFSSKADSERNQVVKIGVGRVRDVNARAGSDNVRKPFDALRLMSGHFDRVVSDEVPNGKLIQSATRQGDLDLGVAPAYDHRHRLE